MGGMKELYPARLTVEDVEAAVRELAADKPADAYDIWPDSEASHSNEDAIREAVIEAIAIGQLSDVDAQRACLAALSTRELGFSRWCA
jgi:hypothetical protein